MNENEERAIQDADASRKGALGRFVLPISTQGVNVGQSERLASGVIGGLLLLIGFKRRTLGGTALAVLGATLIERGLSGHSRLYQWTGQNTASPRPADSPAPSNAGQSVAQLEAGDDTPPPAQPGEIKHAITIGKPIELVYEFWRDGDNLAQIMSNFAEVTVVEGGDAHWKMKAPLGQSIEWDTRVTEDTVNERVRWESLPGALLRNEGTMTFRPAPGNRGTEVLLHFKFEAPGGALGDKATKLFNLVPSGIASKSLHNFKSLMETGELATLKGNVSARTDALANAV